MIRFPHQRRVSQPVPSVRRGLAGFTLIELLIVMTIISVLVVLTVRVVGALMTQSKEAATQATIRQIHALLKLRMEAFHRMYGGNDVATIARLQTTSEYQQTGSFGVSNTIRLILTRKALFRKFFPQQASEVDWVLQPKFINNTTATSAEILYDFLTQSTVLGGVPEGTDTFSTAAVRDTDNNGLSEFVDAWGKPLRFYRWPTRLIRPSGLPAGPPYPVTDADLVYARLLFNTLPQKSDLQRDSEDPLGLAATQLNNAVFEKNFHTAATYHTPLIISAGPDGNFGMFPPDDPAASAGGNYGYLGAVDVPNSADLLDNLTNLNMRIGGK